MGRPSIHQLYNETYQSEAENYKNYLQVLGYNTDTCQARYLYLKAFFSWLERQNCHQLKDITPVEIAQYQEYISQQKSTKSQIGLTRKTIYDHMRLVQAYLGYALHLGKITTNPASHLKFTYPNERVERMVFTQAEIRELYQAAENQQERAILSIAYGCGLRVAELSQLNKEDIRLTENIVIVQKGKNNKRRLVPIPEKVKEELQQYLEGQKETKRSDARRNDARNQAVFYNNKQTRMQEWTFNKLLKKMVRRTSFGKRFTDVELNSIGIHSLRHSIATHLLENGMKLEQVQTFLGHSHIESTEIYTHISQTQINEMKQ